MSSRERLSITKDWLPRYTGMEIDEFGDYILLTNFSDYVIRFSEMFDVEIKGLRRPMQAAIEEPCDVRGTLGLCIRNNAHLPVQVGDDRSGEPTCGPPATTRSQRR